MERSQNPENTVERKSAIPTKQRLGPFHSVPQCALTVERGSTKTKDLHAETARKAFGYVTPWTRRVGKAINHFRLNQLYLYSYADSLATLHSYAYPLASRSDERDGGEKSCPAPEDSSSGVFWWP